MLVAQHLYKVDKLIRLFEARKKKIFLELLMVVFYEAADALCGVGQSVGRKILLCIDATQCFAINQKHAL